MTTHCLELSLFSDFYFTLLPQLPYIAAEPVGTSGPVFSKLHTFAQPDSFMRLFSQYPNLYLPKFFISNGMTFIRSSQVFPVDLISLFSVFT